MSSPHDLPIDMNHPSVRDYVALVRLQVLTPLSLLISLATVMITTFIVTPSLGLISKMHPTPVTPSPILVGIYFLAIFASQLGYCILMVLAFKEETRQTIIKGSGFSIVVANWLIAIWAVTWSFQAFIPSTIFLSLMVLVLLYSNIVLLLSYPPTNSRPMDILLIHTPARLFLLLPATLLLPQSIFIMLGKTWNPTCDTCESMYQWEGFAVVMATNLIALVVIATRRDFVWCAGAVWSNICMLAEHGKSTPVQTAAIFFTVLDPILLTAILVWTHFKGSRSREGPIALPADDEDQEHRVHVEEGDNSRGENVGRVWG